MRQHHSNRIVKALIAATLAISASAASAGTYQFVQTGFTDNASVVGFFQGQDNNHDGIISGTEVWHFGARFIGGYYDGFSFTSTSRYPTYISYVVGSGVLGNHNGDYLDSYSPAQIGYIASTSGGRIYGFSSEPVLISNQYVQVQEPTAIPEPETYALLLTGLGMLAWLARRKRFF
jgi:hypothetical protein